MTSSESPELKGSGDSSSSEGPPFRRYGDRPVTCACGHARLDHTGGPDEAACEVMGCDCTQIRKPDSASSSPDEPPMCRCGHSPASHDALRWFTCIGNRNLCGCEMYAPAEPEQIHKWKRCGCGHPQHASKCRAGGTLNFCGCTKVTPLEDIAARCRDAGGCPDHPAEQERRYCSDSEHDWCDWGAVYHGGHLVWRRCATCQATESRTEGHSCPECTPEPEAPECEHPRPYNYGLRNGPPVRRSWLCQDCKAKWETVAGEIVSEAPELCHCGIGTPEECATGPAGCGPNSLDPKPPRRPPYAVAYATEDGTQFEVALPGDATVRALDGALVITHGSAVQALIQIRPMEGA